MLRDESTHRQHKCKFPGEDLPMQREMLHNHIIRGYVQQVANLGGKKSLARMTNFPE